MELKTGMTGLESFLENLVTYTFGVVGSLMIVSVAAISMYRFLRKKVRD